MYKKEIMFPHIHFLGLEIPMYGIMLAIGFLVCSVISWYRTKKRGKNGDNLILIAAFLFGFAMIGGVLFYLFVTYTPAQILALIRAGEWEALLQGGIVFYGALIGGVIGAVVGSRVAHDDIRDYLDIIVPTIPLGHALGRIGCFCAGCCYGRPTQSAIGVVYSHPVGGAPVGIALLPVQLFESAVLILIFIILMTVSRKTESRYLTTVLYCLLYGIARFVLEFFRYDSIRGIAGGLSTSQWISIGLVAGAVLFGILYKTVRRSRQAA